MGMWSLILIWDHEPIFIIEVMEVKMYIYVRHVRQSREFYVVALFPDLPLELPLLSLPLRILYNGSLSFLPPKY